MITDVYVDGTRFVLNPSLSIGKGGEADVFDFQSAALKVFKTPDHLDYKDEPEEQTGAAERIELHQQKLPALIKLAPRLPSRAITPIKLATDRSGKFVVGYTMRFLKGAEVLLSYSEKSYHDRGLSNQAVTNIFIDLHSTVASNHNIGLVIGDFNALNVLVIGEEAYVIDVDSAQFGQFLCKLYTECYVDPLCCDPLKKEPVLVRPYNENSDWFSYSVMLMRSLLCVGPYGGVYHPKDRTKRVPHSARPLRRVTIFDPDVIYPKGTMAFHYGALPDDLVQQLYNTFKKDQRGEFPVKLLKDLRWTKCTACGAEHARSKCPSCAKAAPAAIKEVTVVRGKVKATRIFQTRGTIVFAAYQKHKLRWLYHENGQYKREDGSTVLKGDLSPRLRFRIQDNATLIGGPSGKVLVSSGVTSPRGLSTTVSSATTIDVDCYGNLPVFDANGNSYYWLQSGSLLRDWGIAAKHIGSVLANQTLFWVGPSFGFGFYRAGNLSVAFVFNADQSGINDSVKLPPLRGQLIDSACFFTQNYCWFLVATQEKGKTINRCVVIRADGSVKATAEAEAGDGSWLSQLRGKCAIGEYLFVATDSGIIRVEIDGDSIVKTGEFPDTEPFVSSGSHLFPGEGIYVVDRDEIKLLQIG